MPSSGLYLVLPTEFDAARHSGFVSEAIAIARPDAIRLTTTDPEMAKTAVQALMPLTRRHNIALMLTDLPSLARELECDGVHLSRHSPLMADARQKIGDTLQLGMSCGASRDEAMSAGEADVDYVAFENAPPELIEWWTDIAELPLVAEDVTSIETARAMIASGADFLALTPDLLDIAASLERFRAIHNLLES